MLRASATARNRTVLGVMTPGNADQFLHARRVVEGPDLDQHIQFLGPDNVLGAASR